MFPITLSPCSWARLHITEIWQWGVRNAEECSDLAPWTPFLNSEAESIRQRLDRHDENIEKLCDRYLQVASTPDRLLELVTGGLRT